MPASAITHCMGIKMEEGSENVSCGQKNLGKKSVFANIQKLPIFLGLVLSHGNIGNSSSEISHRVWWLSTY